LGWGEEKGIYVGDTLKKNKNYVYDNAKFTDKYWAGNAVVYLAESIHSPERQVNSSSGLQQSLSSSPPAHSRSPSHRPAHLPDSSAKSTLYTDKKENQISSYLRKFSWDLLQSRI
jgi:hypothetical protein